MKLLAEVWFDFVCPWCAIGKRNLELALATLESEEPALRVEVRWHGVQLLPAIPAQGVPFAEFYARRLGGPEAVRARQAQVREAATQAGLELAFDRIRVMPNTADAHRLLAWAARDHEAVHAGLLARLFDAYFVAGEDIGDRTTLLGIARECGLDATCAAPCLDQAMAWNPAPLDGGVPLFVFGRRLALSGAHPPETLVHAMRQAAAQSAPAEARA